MSKQIQVSLDESDIAMHLYNIMADMKNRPFEPLHPETLEPIGPALSPFPNCPD